MSTVVPLRRPNGIRALVAGEVRAWMGRRGVNQTALATAIGLSQSQVSKRLKGTIPFDIDELARIADCLGVDIAELVGGIGDNSTTPPDDGEALRARRYSKPQPSDPKVLGFLPLHDRAA